MLKELRQCVLWLCLIIVTGLAGGCTSLIVPRVQTQLAQLKAGQYQIDPAHTALIFKVEHLGLSTYVGRFNTVYATLAFDPDNLAATKLNAIIDTASIDVNNADLEATLQKRGWFNSREFPQATFTTLSAKPLAGGGFALTGALTLRGITKPVVLNASFNGGATNWLTGRYTLGFSATAQLQRSEFGLDKYTDLVSDHVRLEIDAEFLRQ